MSDCEPKYFSLSLRPCWFYHEILMSVSSVSVSFFDRASIFLWKQAVWFFMLSTFSIRAINILSRVIQVPRRMLSTFPLSLVVIIVSFLWAVLFIAYLYTSRFFVESQTQCTVLR